MTDIRWSQYGQLRASQNRQSGYIPRCCSHSRHWQ